MSLHCVGGVKLLLGGMRREVWRHDPGKHGSAAFIAPLCYPNPNPKVDQN